MKYIFFCLIVIHVRLDLVAQRNLKVADQLDNIGLYNVPSLEELENITLDNDWLHAKEIKSYDINTSYDNIEDLKWLKDKALDNKVIMLGENHYYKYIHNLRNRMFFALNKYDEYPLIVLENQYSITGYVNHYLSINEEVKAKIFFKEELHKMILTKEDSTLIQKIRNWNIKNPKRKLKVGYSDIEHDYRTTINKIIVPYFNSIAIPININVEDVTVSDLGGIIDEFRNKLKIAEKDKRVGKYPFLTVDYIRTVVDNLESLYKSYRYEFNYYRQKAMIRNITNNNFLGKYWKGKKIFLHAGSYHTPSKFKYPDNGNFYREGSYLSYEFPYTKGKTYSVLAIGHAKSLDKMANIDLKECLHVGSSYRRSINKFQKAYKKKLINSQEPFYEWKIKSLDSLIVKKALYGNMNGIVVSKIKWDAIFTKMRSENKDDYKKIKNERDTYSRYDKLIFFVSSPINETRLK